MSEKLFTEFEPVSSKQWKQQIQFELKGADYEKGLQAAIEIWDEVAKKDAASAKLVAMQKDYMKQMGYLK